MATRPTDIDRQLTLERERLESSESDRDSSVSGLEPGSSHSDTSKSTLTFGTRTFAENKPRAASVTIPPLTPEQQQEIGGIVEGILSRILSTLATHSPLSQKHRLIDYAPAYSFQTISDNLYLRKVLTTLLSLHNMTLLMQEDESRTDFSHKIADQISALIRITPHTKQEGVLGLYKVLRDKTVQQKKWLAGDESNGYDWEWETVKTGRSEYLGHQLPEFFTNASCHHAIEAIVNTQLYPSLEQTSADTSATSSFAPSPSSNSAPSSPGRQGLYSQSGDIRSTTNAVPAYIGPNPSGSSS